MSSLCIKTWNTLHTGINWLAITSRHIKGEMKIFIFLLIGLNNDFDYKMIDDFPQAN